MGILEMCEEVAESILEVDGTVIPCNIIEGNPPQSRM
jgi:hypothetical protein